MAVLPDQRLWWLPQAVFIARDQVLAIEKERRSLLQRAREWMQRDHRRTVGEANDYIGIERLNDDLRAAKAELRRALEAMAARSKDILAALGRED